MAKKKPSPAWPAPARVARLLPPMAPWLAELGAFIPGGYLGGASSESPYRSLCYQSGLVLGGGGGRGGAFVVKTQSITVDVDLKLHPAIMGRYGDEKQAKQGLYAMSQADVLGLMDEVNFFAEATENLRALAGLPAAPNRAVFTGHGVALQFWLDDLTGLGPMAPRRQTNGWFNQDLREIANLAKELPGLWAWDPDAGAVGTRLSPAPGQPHRVTGPDGWAPNGKTVFELLEVGLWRPHDEFLVTPEVLARMSALVEPLRRQAARGGGKKRREGVVARSTQLDVPFKYVAWDSRWDEDFAFEHLGTHMPCPECSRHTLSRSGSRYTCWHAEHRTVYSVVHRRPCEEDDGWPDFVSHVEVEFNGPHAMWPDLGSFPKQSILAPRTGAGKTWVINELKDRFLADSDPYAAANDQRRVIMICPTKRLAEATAARLSLPFSTPNRKIDWVMGSFVTCFAGFLGLTGTMTVSELRNTMFVVDEVEQCLKQLDGMIDSEKGIKLLEQLTYCVAYSDSVYLADAHAGARTQLLLSQCHDSREIYGKTTSRGKGADLGPFSFVRLWSQPHRFQIKLLPTTVEEGDESAFHHPAWKLVDQVVRELDKGEHVALICWKKDDVDSIAEEIASRLPNKTITKIRGGESDENREALNDDSLTRDLLIYNSAMASGVSVDVPNHYNVRALLTDAEVDGPGFEQMAHRVRAPASEAIIVAADGDVQVSDWRASPEGQDRRAEDAWLAEVAAHRRADGDDAVLGSARYLTEISTARFVDMVMLSRAESFREGRDWLAGWLRQHHDVEAIDLEAGDVYSEVINRKKRSKKERSECFADAPLMTPAAFARAEKRSRRTEVEEASFQATRLAQFFGRGAWQKMDRKDRVELAGDKSAMDKARLWVGAQLALRGHRKALSWWSARANAKSTKADATCIAAASEVVAALYRGFEVQPTQTVESMIALWAPVRAQAESVQDFLQLTPGSPAQRVQSVLASAGVSVRKTRKQEVYKLKADSADFMERVTNAKARDIIASHRKSIETDESF